MRFRTQSRLLNFVIASVLLFAVVVTLSVWDRRPADIREFCAIRDDWETTEFGRPLVGFALPLPGFGPPEPLVLTPEQKVGRIVRHAEQCLELAEKSPDSQGALAALYLLGSRGAELDAGKLARRQLAGKIKDVDLGLFEKAMASTRVRSQELFQEITPDVIDRIRQSPNHPRAAALLTTICSSLAHDSKSETVPDHFTEAADMIVEQYADRPGIHNFCASLGGMYRSPHWAGAFEGHLKTILAKNNDRLVRCMASMAMASVVQLSVDRHAEAEQLFEKFRVDFDGSQEYNGQPVERTLFDSAEQRVTAMRFTPINLPAPEIIGIDLQGQPMKLSDYRGKVVVVSFWASWCFPCMKMVPHERELAARLADKPFAIVGVNGDQDEAAAATAVEKFEIPWRSFRDQRPGQKLISDEWTAFYPTVLLIDHKGIIRQRWTGSPPLTVLDQRIEELIDAVASKQSTTQDAE